jgi:hypothetical protein
MTSIGDPFDGVYSRVSSISSALRNECICFSYIDTDPYLGTTCSPVLLCHMLSMWWKAYGAALLVSHHQLTA